MKNYDVHQTDQSFNYFITNAERVSGTPTDAIIFMGNRLPAQYPYFICKVNEYYSASYAGNVYRTLSLACQNLMVSSYHNFTGLKDYDIVVDARRHHPANIYSQSTESTSYFIVKNFNNKQLNWRLIRSDNFTLAGTFSGANRAWSLSLMMTPLTSDRELVGRPIVSMGQYNTFTMSIGGNSNDQIITIPKINLPYTYYFIDCINTIFDNANLLNDAAAAEYFLLIAHDWFMSRDNSIIPKANVLTMLAYISAVTTTFQPNKSADGGIGVCRMDTARDIRFQMVIANGFQGFGNNFAVLGAIPWRINMRITPIR